MLHIPGDSMAHNVTFPDAARLLWRYLPHGIPRIVEAHVSTCFDMETVCPRFGPMSSPFDGLVMPSVCHRLQCMY